MQIHELFAQRWEAELPAFGRVLKAMPEGQLDYCPHERSTKAGNLGWQLAEEQRVLCDLLDTGVIDWKQRPRPETAAEIVKAWDDATAELRKRIEKLDEAKLASPANFVMGDAGTWTDNVGNMLWGFLFDMVHHRGQLSAYLRPMGGKVPAIYGPSADDNGG
jgi:uncharacterized damage-inducible protein DinB